MIKQVKDEDDTRKKKLYLDSGGKIIQKQFSINNTAPIPIEVIRYIASSIYEGKAKICIKRNSTE